MDVTSRDFVAKSSAALQDKGLQKSLAHLKTGFQVKRRQAAAKLPEFEALRDRARDVKNHVLENLDTFLVDFEAKVTATGGTVHWARDADEARRIVLGICEKGGIKRVTKSKSMVTEEIELNPFLEENGITPVETDLGEYIIQLRHERPSHIVAPAIHLSKDQVSDTFHKHHTPLGYTRRLTERPELVAEARAVLRQRFLDADAGITGANFLVAETGSIVLVTNEGNADLTASLPDTHIVVTGIEKIVPTMEDAMLMVRLLARSATGQEASVYTSIYTGPRHKHETEGPANYHIVLVDNGRSAMIGTEFQDMLRCIRCSACLNHCPVYGATGGHAYGSIYPGPMGAVLTPSLAGIEEAGHLPNASTFCGRCEAVCPVRIPLPRMMRHWREREFEKHLTPRAMRFGLGIWACAANNPRLYRLMTGMSSRLIKLMARQGWITRLPLGGKGWTRHRDMKGAEGGTFQAQWCQKMKKGTRK